MLRSLIRQGAQDGSFDRELGADVAGSRSILREAEARARHRLLRRGRPHRPHRHRRRARLRVLAGRPQHAARSRWASASSARSTAATSCGSPGLDLGARGGGHGRALLAALFATPQGQKTWVLRVQRGSRYVAALQHLLADFGFSWVGDTLRLRWFLRTDAPAELASRVRDAVDARSALN